MLLRGDFTKRKFLNFSPAQQQKKCAEILRMAYEGLIKGSSEESLLDVYCEIALWLKIPPLVDYNAKTLADRYHQHLNNAQLRHREHNLLPSIRKGDKEETETFWPIVIYLDKIRSAHNVGSILRTVDAFALGKVYFSEETPFVDNKQVRDTAMGTELWIDSRREVELDMLPRPIIAMETSPDAIPLFDFIFPDVFTLVMGNEEYGCSDKILRIADYIIEIPMRGRKNSLNVANAFAIASAEIFRQRTKVEKPSPRVGY